MYQRGKNVVSASSGNTTTSQAMPWASRSSSNRRCTTLSRESLRWIGPSCAAPTLTILVMSYSFTSSICEREQRVQQHVGAGLEIRQRGEFLDVVADAADARNEDHPGRTNAGQHLRVVPGAAGQAAHRMAEAASGRFDEIDDGRIECHRLEACQRPVSQRHAFGCRDLAGEFVQALFRLLQPRFVGIAQIDR